MNSKGRVSFLMLSYNHAQFIESSLLSIISQNEYLLETELVIIDDGSTDGTIEIIKHFSEKFGHIVKIRSYFLEHQGISSISKNFLKLTQLATLDYICFIASDDTYAKEAFKEQIEIMEQDSFVQGVFADGTNVSTSGHKTSVMGEIDKRFLSSGSVELMDSYVRTNIPSLFIQSCIVRSKFVKSYESFDTDLIADDWVFNIRFFSELKKSSLSYKFIDKPVFMRNLHTSNTSRNVVSQYKRIRQVCEKYCPNKEKIKSQAFWYSFYIGAKNKDFESIRSLFLYHFDTLAVLVPSFIELFKLFFAKILKR